jgi:hypothetical protein
MTWTHRGKVQLSQAAVRAVRVVVNAPGFDLPPRVEQAEEPAYVETFLAQASVKALDVRVLDWPGWLDVSQFEFPVHTQLNKCPR